MPRVALSQLYLLQVIFFLQTFSISYRYDVPDCRLPVYMYVPGIITSLPGIYYQVPGTVLCHKQVTWYVNISSVLRSALIVGQDVE